MSDLPFVLLVDGCTLFLQVVTHVPFGRCANVLTKVCSQLPSLLLQGMQTLPQCSPMSQAWCTTQRWCTDMCGSTVVPLLCLCGATPLEQGNWDACVFLLPLLSLIVIIIITGHPSYVLMARSKENYVRKFVL